METIYRFIDIKEILILLHLFFVIYIVIASVLFQKEVKKDRTYEELMEELHKGRRITIYDVFMNVFWVVFFGFGVLTLIILFDKEKINNYWLIVSYTIITIIPLSVYIAHLVFKKYYLSDKETSSKTGMSWWLLNEKNRKDN